ncbi:VMAP-C domain-containing protein [Nocardiopsis terrae]
MSNRAEMLLVTALQNTLTFKESGLRGALARYLDAWPGLGTDHGSTEYVLQVSQLALAEQRLAELMRIVYFLDQGSVSARRAWSRVEPLIVREEEDRLLAGIGSARREEARRILGGLRDRFARGREGAEPTEREREAYLEAMGPRALNMSVPEPTCLWECFTDLAEAPRYDGAAPLSLFAERLEDEGDHRDRTGVGALRQWIALRSLGEGPAPGHGDGPTEDADAGEAGEDDSPPARLLVWFTLTGPEESEEDGRGRHEQPDPGDDPRFWVKSWNVLSPEPGRPPQIGPANILNTRVVPGKFPETVFQLLHRLKGHPWCHHHDRIRVELIAPFDVLMGLEARHWEPPSSLLSQRIRLGIDAEIIYRVEEFLLLGDVEHDFARRSVRRRWGRIDREREAHMVDRQCDEIPESVRFVEYATNERVILFATGHHEPEDVYRDIHSAMMVGVPVILWRTRQRSSRETFRAVLAGKEEKVPLEAVASLPALLRESGRGTVEPLGGRITDSLDVGMIFHDLLPHPLEPSPLSLGDGPLLHTPQARRPTV